MLLLYFYTFPLPIYIFLSQTFWRAINKVALMILPPGVHTFVYSFQV